MSTLYTITGNLLAEVTAWFESAAPGGTHRARRETFQVGGKGINVARMAQRLDWPAHALCFPAGFTGARCAEWLQAQPFETTLFTQPGESRLGLVVRIPSAPETTFLGPDVPIDATVWCDALQFLETQLRAGDYLCLSGSVPGWRPEISGPFLVLVRLLLARNFVAIDTYGPPLVEMVQLPLSLVKINRREWDLLVGALPSARASLHEAPPASLNNLPTEEAELAMGLAWAVRSLPVQRWVVTDGSRPVWAAETGGQLYRVLPPLVNEVSPTGSGDVLMAGLLHALANHSTLSAALAFALPLSSANAASAGVADFDLAKLPAMPANALTEYLTPAPGAGSDQLR